MHPVRVIFERGITAKLIDSDWHIINLNGGRTERIDPRTIESTFRVRPIVLTNGHRNDNLLLRINTRELFAFDINDFETCAVRNSGSGALNNSYLLRSLQYHCTQLALSYAHICESFAYFPIPIDEDVATFGSNPEPYFEFESLVTTIRRTYDYFRYMLWQHFGDGGSISSNFCKTLEKCRDRMPPQLASRLETSWSKFGDEITAYRDCLIHYSPTTFGMGASCMQKLPNEAWSLIVRIPDNPISHSQRQFVWDQQRDALTYGWEATNEILNVATILAEHLKDLRSNTSST
jgi:hypothetical protein